MATSDCDADTDTDSDDAFPAALSGVEPSDKGHLVTRGTVKKSGKAD